MVGKKRPSLEGRIVVSLFAAVRAIAAEIRRAGASDQITVPQYSTLRLLEEGDISVSELARTMRVAMPTVTQSTDSLVNKGLVERYADERDRRQVKLRITPAGLSLAGQCHRAVEAYLADTLSSWPRERQEELATALESLVHLVEEARLARQA